MLDVPPVNRTSLAQLLAQRQIDAQTVTYQPSSDWAQGRTTFGGLIAALSVQAMYDIVGQAWPEQLHLLTLQVNFLAPVAAGELTIQVHSLRQGKNIHYVQALAKQGETVSAILIGVFGLQQPPHQLPYIQPSCPTLEKTPANSLNLPFVPGLTPNFLQHFDVAWATGGLPYTGQGQPRHQLFIRLKELVEQQPLAATNVAFETLIALFSDTPPAAALSYITGPAPASSVAWTLELHHPASLAHFIEHQQAWWRLDTDTIVSNGHGYVNQQTTVWAPDGQLAAIGYQTIAIYAPR